MSQKFQLDVQVRHDIGKGASRRLRREQDRVPAILYGGDREPLNLSLAANKVKKALENKAFYTSILKLNMDGKTERAVVKAIQRHPYKAIIQHMDFQRVSPNQQINMHVPFHFLNEETAPGVKSGGMVSHNITGIDIRCKAKDLPEFIEVDMGNIELGGVFHLSDVKLPSGVEMTIDISDESHNQPVASIHKPKGAGEIEDEDASAEGADAEESGDNE